MDTPFTNRHIALVMAPPSSGKSSSLRNLKNPERVVYFNTDRKALPFKSKFLNVFIDDPMDIFSYLDEIGQSDEYDTIIIDTITFLMDMYETQYVVTSADTRSAWGDYGQYYKQLIDKCLSIHKTIIVLAHEAKDLNEQSMVMESRVPIKGSVGKTGVEANFEVVLSAKKIPSKKLDQLGKIPLLQEDDPDEVGIHYVFQTKLTKDTVNEKMRSPMGLWKKEEVYINNDIQLVIDRLNEYYAD